MEGSGVGGLHIQKYFKSYVIHWRKIQLSLQLQGGSKYDTLDFKKLVRLRAFLAELFVWLIFNIQFDIHQLGKSDLGLVGQSKYGPSNLHNAQRCLSKSVDSTEEDLLIFGKCYRHSKTLIPDNLCLLLGI